ncbi:MAG: bifunctional folylpolyglutamate synthase/dihydrofolate synthase [Gemmata sp.]
MTYDEALGFWYARVNFEVRSAGPLDLKLERMRALLNRLGDPQDCVRLVHVTGTKGKGSTCAMIASVLRAAGYRVGLFTSPHLEHVEERIQVDGAPISHAELASCMSEVAPAVRAMEAETEFPSPTFFEICTALGFLHFVRRRCDIAVLEVGLGGRFDSTNVCRPLVSVITNVGPDHTAQLGNTLEEIAHQKAGIIKPRTPAVSGVTQDGPRAVVRRAAEQMNAPLFEASAGRRPPVLPALLGAHQLANAAVAIAALDRLRDTGMHVPDAAVRRGLADVKWPARVEVVRTSPVVILDTAHNVPSAEALVGTLRDSFPHAGAKRVVFAVSADKQYAEILRVFASYFDFFHLTKYGNNPRCVPPDRLADTLAEVARGKPFGVHDTAAEAWRAARTAASDSDLVCVTGSVFLAGELRPLVGAIGSSESGSGPCAGDRSDTSPARAT